MVQKPGDDDLTVRSRVKTDLDRLRAKCMPTLEAIQSTPSNDYPYRAKISHADFSAGMAKLCSGIDYDNFKDTVSERMGYRRASAYGGVWSHLYDLTELEEGIRDYEEVGGWE